MNYILFLIISLIAVSTTFLVYKLTKSEGAKTSIKSEEKSITKIEKNNSSIIPCNLLFDAVDKLNITYFIGFGTELQAYRDGILKNNDHDIDIMIPVWMNSHIFGCSEYKRVNRKKWHNTSVKITDKFRLCGKNFTEYQLLLKNYLRDLKHSYMPQIIHIVMYLYNTQVYLNSTYDKYYLDAWPMISNEWTYVDDIEIVNCKFCGRNVKCIKNPLKSILINYGPDWNVPSGKSNVDPMYIDSLD